MSCALAIEMSQSLQCSESMNKPDSKHRRRLKRRSLVVVALILLPLLAYIVWTNRPLSSEEQRLVGRWTIEVEGQVISQTCILHNDRLGTTTLGGTDVNEYDWSIRGRQLIFVPYQYRSQKNSINNLYQHCVLVMNSIALQTPYPADRPQLYSMQWIDDDTLKLTSAPGSIAPTGFTATMHREPQ